MESKGSKHLYWENYIAWIVSDVTQMVFIDVFLRIWSYEIILPPLLELAAIASIISMALNLHPPCFRIIRYTTSY